jgi:hypothetical protein
MRNRRATARLLSVVALFALAAAGLSGCGWLDSDHFRTVRYGVSAPVHTLVVKGHTGDVRVTGGGSTVSVTEKQSYRDSPPHTTHDVAGGTLTLTYDCQDCGVGYEVHVPADTVVTVTEDTGDVSLAGLSGAVEASTQTGDVTATGLSARQARLTAETGDVRAEFGATPTSVYATAQTGDVGVTVPQGTSYTVRADAATGDVRVGVARADDGAHSITASAQTGDVTVGTA